MDWKKYINQYPNIIADFKNYIIGVDNGSVIVENGNLYILIGRKMISISFVEFVDYFESKGYKFIKKRIDTDDSYSLTVKLKGDLVDTILSKTLEEVYASAIHFISKEVDHTLIKFGNTHRKNKAIYIKAVCNVYDVNFEDLVSKMRERILVEPRQVLGVLLYVGGGYSLNAAGEIIGRDHSTILYYKKTVKNLYSTDSGYRETMWQVFNRIELHFPGITNFILKNLELN